MQPGGIQLEIQVIQMISWAFQICLSAFFFDGWKKQYKNLNWEI